LRASVKAAAPACLGRVLRFYKDKDLGARYPGNLHSNNGLVLDGIRVSLPKEAMSYVAPRVQNGIAQLIYVAVKEGDEQVAKRLVAASAQLLSDGIPAHRIAGVHVLSHVVSGVPTLQDAWRVLVMCLGDPDSEVGRVASMYLGDQVTRKSNTLVPEAVIPTLHELLTQGHNGKQLQNEARTRVMEVASIAATSVPRTSLRDRLADMALLMLQGVFSAAVFPALQVLIHLGTPLPEGAVSAVLCQLKQQGDIVCLPACQALVSMVQRGNAEAIAGVSKALKGFKGSTADRAEIAHCLARLAKIGGDHVASEAFLELLATFPESPECKTAALLGLESTARVGHDAVRSAAMSELDLQVTPAILMASAAVLKTVCHVGDVDAAGLLLKVLATDASARNPKLVVEVINALVEICPPGDPFTLERLSQQLNSGLWPIRHIALQSIKALAPASSNSLEARAAVLRRLQDVHPDVRQCAVDVLSSVASPGDSEVLAALVALREEEQPVQVEVAIEEALEILSGDVLAEPGCIEPSTSVPWTQAQTPRDHPATSETSFQLVDGSKCSFQVIDGTISQSSFQVVDGISQHSSRPFTSGSDSSFQILPASVTVDAVEEQPLDLSDVDIGNLEALQFVDLCQ